MIGVVREGGSVMRRIQLVLAALAIVVTSFAAFAGPAMANGLDCRDAKGKLIRCDNGKLYEPFNRDHSQLLHNDFLYPCNPHFFNPYCLGGMGFGASGTSFGTSLIEDN
jgi:hypothetical protein